MTKNWFVELPHKASQGYDIAIREDNKYWPVATIHAMSGCSDPEQDITIEEAQYNAELIKHAPKLLELLIEYVGRVRYPDAYKQKEFSISQLTYSAKMLCDHLIDKKKEVIQRKDKYQIGDVVELSKPMIQEAILRNGMGPSLLKVLISPLTVVDIIDVDIESQKGTGHPQIITVRDSTGRIEAASGGWFNLITREEKKFNLYDRVNEADKKALLFAYGENMIYAKAAKHGLDKFEITNVFGKYFLERHLKYSDGIVFKATSETEWYQIFNELEGDKLNTLPPSVDLDKPPSLLEKTCETCVDFWPVCGDIKNLCGCPMNANSETSEYLVLPQGKDTKACTFYSLQ